MDLLSNAVAHTTLLTPSRLEKLKKNLPWNSKMEAMSTTRGRTHSAESKKSMGASDMVEP